jgi:NTP pyrophosphatase (non-canonical NTP hydrolase)
MTALTYETARRARLAIQSKFQDDCADWTLADWSNAALGELGEAANIIKKIRRKDFLISDPGVREALAFELADALAYIDLLAYHAGIDLSEAVEDKFNSLCDRHAITDISLDDGKLIIGP